LAVKLVESIVPDDDTATLLHCVDLFLGKKKKKTASELAKIKGFGAGSDLDRGDAQRLFQRLVCENALTEVNEVNGCGFASSYVRMGPRAREFSRGERQLKIQIRLSPSKPQGLSTESHPTRARRGGDEHPDSTNVSSPVQAMSRRQRGRNFRTAQPIEEEEFDDDYDDEYEEEDDDGFAPIREIGKSVRKEDRTLGPPITGDQKLSNLDFIHKLVLEHFMTRAKEECRKVSFSYLILCYH
jgi:bloom syndrome protein